jgi:hypothetical protein
MGLFFSSNKDVAPGVTIILWFAVIVIGLVLLIGGGTFIYKFLNELIIEPVQGGEISALGMIILGAFVLVLFNKFRKRNLDDEWTAEQIRQSRRQY